MLAMPFAIVGTLGFLLWRASKVRPPKGPTAGAPPTP